MSAVDEGRYVREVEELRVGSEISRLVIYRIEGKER